MSSIRCPYCREGFGEELCTYCDGCSTMYHKGCANELGECGTAGCGARIRTKEELPLTGNSMGSFDPRPIVIVGFAVGVVPFVAVLEWFLIKEGHYSAAFLIALPVVLMGLLVGLPMITGGKRLGRTFIGR